ncbi:MAG TPA: DUF3090 family protein [Acidimicrobiales bacterium]|nr:DUF3090 family protein [Acidimicrobiales bacterium]
MASTSASFTFDDPDFFVVGAVGEPGSRVFYLQAGQDDTVVALRCEKQHVAALAHHLAELLADLPPTAPDPNSRTLHEPVEADWILGTLAFGFDTESGRIDIIASELTEGLPGDPPGGEARFAISRGQAASLIATTEELLAGSRPLCHLCGLPMDPAGHVCPRTNGHSAG